MGSSASQGQLSILSDPKPKNPKRPKPKTPNPKPSTYFSCCQAALAPARQRLGDLRHREGDAALKGSLLMIGLLFKRNPKGVPLKGSEKGSIRV